MKGPNKGKFLVQESKEKLSMNYCDELSAWENSGSLGKILEKNKSTIAKIKDTISDKFYSKLIANISNTEKKSLKANQASVLKKKKIAFIAVRERPTSNLLRAPPLYHLHNRASSRSKSFRSESPILKFLPSIYISRAVIHLKPSI